MTDEAFEALMRDVGIGILLGFGVVIFIVIMIAVGDRRPPDKKDGK